MIAWPLGPGFRRQEPDDRNESSRRVQCHGGHITDMECHYCEAEADVVVEKSGIRVGVCERHFREQMEQLAAEDTTEQLREQLDIDRAE